MRVLVLTNMYPPHAYGGYELSCRDVMARWRRRGHDVMVLTSDWCLPGTPEITTDPSTEGGVPVRRELRLYWDDHRIVDPPLRQRLAIERANQASLRRALCDHRPDVVSAWAMGAMSLGLLTTVLERAVPVVPVVCDEWPVYGPEVDAWTRPLARRPRLARAVRLLTRLPTGIPPLERAVPTCFVSDALRAVVRQRSPWSFALGPVTFSGIDPDDFPFHPRPPWSWHLLYVGRIDRRKGIDTAIRALATFPSTATLSVVGHGDDEHLGELRRLAGELGVADRVTFTSAGRDRLASHYASADALLFTSTWEEPFGLVPLEAMACGTPVVATATGGSAEFLSHGHNCLTVPPGDHAALLASVHRLEADSSLRHRLVAGGRRTAADLDVNNLAEVLERAHRWALGDPGVDRPVDRVLPVMTAGAP